MTAAAFHDDDVRRLAEASAWRVALSEADTETTPEFELWLTEPANEAAWDEIQAGWRAVGDHAESPELLALRRDALDRAHRESRRRWTTDRRWLAPVAACLALLVSVGALLTYLTWRADQPVVYATQLGERRVVTLDDGSRISLDAGTEVTVRYTDEARTLDLVRGQARFDVAHDAARRFLVKAGGHSVVATGTAFNVDLMGSEVRVTLIEGSVVVLDGAAAERAGAARGISLRAGQQLTAAPRAPPAVADVSLERATAWERGQLIFEDESLASITSRVSRYSVRPVVVEPSAAGLRISGVFRAGDVDTFVDTVTRYLPVRATRRADGAVVLTAA